jgi:acetyl esterase/lipase
MTEIEVDDTIFHNGHTSRSQKESILAEFVNSGYLPSKFRNHDLNEIVLKNDTTNKYSRLTDIILDRNLSPLLVDDTFLLKNTPKNTFLITTELDILRDDGWIYAERLRKLGLTIQHTHYENLFHGVLNLLHGPLGKIFEF